MSELDEYWSRQLTGAIESAKATGREALADYLALKAANDAVRRQGVTWLLDSVIRHAAEANRELPAIEIEREEPHSFKHREANLVGALVRCRLGVRSMTVEAGWTRTPSDGFMRLGALAFARITHFGLPRSNAELILNSLNEFPVWLHVRDDRPADEFDHSHVREHVNLLHGP